MSFSINDFRQPNLHCNRICGRHLLRCQLSSQPLQRSIRLGTVLQSLIRRRISFKELEFLLDLLETRHAAGNSEGAILSVKLPDRNLVPGFCGQFMCKEMI